MAEDTELLKELDKCAKCGQCRAVCPVFLALRDEKLVTRGRLALLQLNSEARPSVSPSLGSSVELKQLAQILDTCLMCQRCENDCPSLVKTSAIFKAERKRIAQEKGLPILLKLGFRWVLPHRWLYDWVLRLGSWVLPATKPVRHLPLSFANLFQHMPKLAPKSALKQIPLSPPLSKGEAGGFKVALFIGCAANYIYPNIIEQLTAILNHHKIPFVIPAKQVCCGFPALLSGDEETADRLEKINADAFASADTILTVCPTCNKMLSQEYKAMNKRNIKVIDAFDFVAQIPNPKIRNPKSNIGTIYHKPCHSTDTTSANIISFLKAHTKYQQVEEDLCCGGGGLFSFKYPELSDQIGQARIQSLLFNNSAISTPQSAITLVTNCPGCMMQLEYLLSANKIQNVKVRHSVEMMHDICKTDKVINEDKPRCLPENKQ